ncbi:MAG: Hsp20/alpha crystallin family protein [Burkholderiales bacterium]|nr:Hsp20/alpha crystallin family protein [Burkholderiales bacterium]
MNDTTAVASSKTSVRNTPDTTSRELKRNDAAMMPPVDVIEDAAGITLRADLPGVGKDKLNLRVEADTLTIEGEVSIPTPEGMEASYAEVGLPRYRRVFTLSKELDTAKVAAEFRNGVLSLRIPKAEHAQPRRIEIKVS